MKHKINWKALIKAVTWRFIATSTTIAIVFISTGSLEISVGVGIMDIFIKIFLYYMHERAWAKIRIQKNGDE